MFLAMLLLVLAAQGFAIFVTGIARRNRIALSFCGLWGVLSFSVSGFTFPVPAMPQLMQLMSDLFPMRHYYLLYVDQAVFLWPTPGNLIWLWYCSFCCRY